MPRDSSALADSLARRLRSLESTRIRIVDLANRGQLTQRAVGHMYEGLYLSAHVAFEGFIEELFIGLLVTGQGVQSSRSDIVPRVTVKTHAIAREMVIGSRRRYIDWLPYTRTEELAKIYFRGGRPFSELTDQQKEVLSKCHKLRNAIAHKSRHSLAEFEKKVIGGTPLPPTERQPAGYLKGYFRITPAQTRYENFVAQLLLIARQLSI